MRSCPNCGKEYEEDKKYCSRCGAIFSNQRKPVALICGKCGTSNNFDFRFCKKCGNDLTAKECSTTRSASEETLSADKKEKDSGESSQAGHNTVFSPQTGSRPESEDSTRKAGNQLGDLNGEELFEESLRMILMDRGTPEERIDLISKALSHGLPLDAEVKAHAFIGSELFNVGADDEAIHHYEQSLKLGSNQGPMPEDDTMLLLCRKLCLKYVLIARKTEESQKSQECLAFLESKCAALKGLSSPVLYVELATLLANQGDIDKASTYFEKAARCPVVDEMDE
ncbi:MAG: zinc ribbon domain-containing protein [Spirochaetaceae bacterium]|nr:zinc ribbon domain-containing protein [Spirochaetaceae bacterium]